MTAPNAFTVVGEDRFAAEATVTLERRGGQSIPVTWRANGWVFEKEKREKGVEKNIYIDVCIHTLTYIDIRNIRTYMLHMWVCIIYI